VLCTARSALVAAKAAATVKLPVAVVRAKRPVPVAPFAPASKAARCPSTASSRTSISEVNAEVLAKAGLVRPGVTSLKVLGDGEISRALKVTAQKFTGSAKAKLEKAGGQAVEA
jgi:hypothetical protein